MIFRRLIVYRSKILLSVRHNFVKVIHSHLVLLSIFDRQHEIETVHARNVYYICEICTMYETFARPQRQKCNRTFNLYILPAE